jgi:hypothetical protein
MMMLNGRLLLSVQLDGRTQDTTSHVVCILRDYLV